jgi:hypothetical protein
MGTVTGIVSNDGKVVEVYIHALENSLFDWRAFVGYSDFAG